MNTPQIKDIRPILELKDPFDLVFWLVVLTSVIVVLFVCRYIWQRSRKNNNKTLVTEKTISPYQWFMQQLDQLDHTYGAERANLYCHHLSFILRSYIEKQYAFPATDRTSEEIVADIQNQTNYSKKDCEVLKQLFEIIDPVKYASRSADATTLKKVRGLAYQLVHDDTLDPATNSGGQNAA